MVSRKWNGHYKVSGKRVGGKCFFLCFSVVYLWRLTVDVRMLAFKHVTDKNHLIGHLIIIKQPELFRKSDKHPGSLKNDVASLDFHMLVHVCSLLGLPQNTKLNAEERKEMKRRTMQMLLYLMRSPFYDNYTR